MSPLRSYRRRWLNQSVFSVAQISDELPNDLNQADERFALQLGLPRPEATAQSPAHGRPRQVTGPA